MKWALILGNPARRGLRDVPRADIDQIDAAFEEMRSDPYSGDIKFLKGADRERRSSATSYKAKIVPQRYQILPRSHRNHTLWYP